ncbi:MAG: 30S ribosomal protein S1 [Anaerolineae bacterium]|nr:30S ribosomal protein S1 [Anaerolineae bacterium]
MTLVNDTLDLSQTDFGALLDQYDYTPPQRGQILESTILQTTDHEIIVDVGLKRDAIVPARDLEHLDAAFLAGLSAGDTVRVEVLRPYSVDGDLLVSINRAMALADWERAVDYMDESTIVEAEIIGQNKGGLLTRFGRLRGFVPNSHVIRGSQARQHDQAKEELIGTSSTFKIIEVDRMRNRLVMSQREAQRESRLQRLQELEPGTVVTGPIVHIVDFGAFVDLGGVDGLIHISRLAHEHIRHPSEVVSIGEEVSVRIESVDVERERVGLNRRDLLPSPWDDFAEQFKPGDLLTGTITNVVDFGVFVQVTEGIQGLAHISSMSLFGFSHPSEMFRTGDEILVRIINIDAERGRVALSTDDVSLEEQQEWLHARHTGEEDDTADASEEAEAAMEVDDAAMEADAAADDTAAADDSEQVEATTEEISVETTEAVSSEVE